MALFVRKLAGPEEELIEKLMGHAESDLPKGRLRIIQLSAQGRKVPEISKEVDLHPINVRKWIHRFNQRGIDGLRSGKSPGRPPLFTDTQREKITRIASMEPRALGLHFSRWSLQRLRQYLIEHGIVQCISVETVRQIIQSQGIHSFPTGKFH